jgi:hypothetical protein
MQMNSARWALASVVGGLGLVIAIVAGALFLGGGATPPATAGPGRTAASPLTASPSSPAPQTSAADTSPDASGIAAVSEGSAAAPSLAATATSPAPRTTATPAPLPPAPTATPRPPAPTATPRPPAPTAPPNPGGPCYVFPSSNVWNRDVSGLPVASNSAVMVSAIGINAVLHPDFDAIGDGIPYNVVDSSTATYNVGFDYADESDPGPYPIPSSPRIEGGSDRHLLSIDLGACKLYELYAARRSGSSWSAGSGAVFDLRSNALRPAGWTSADAAGLPIFPGLVRYEEVRAGAINHAIRFTAPDTCGYIYPARHLTADPCSNLPPMGLRVRLKASVDISGFGPHARIVLTALKRYGMILADNGSPWYISGAPDSRWNDDEMHRLQNLTGADFEVVDTSGLRNG